MSKLIVVKTFFEAVHCWPECPIEAVSFLKYPHRHVFYVTVKWKVNHNDRDKEFIYMKMCVTQTLQHLSQKMKEEKEYLRMSCEDIADYIHSEFNDCCFVSVFEDDENGVEAYYD